MDDDEFRDQFRTVCGSSRRSRVDDEVASSLAGRILYVAARLDDPALYERLKAKLDEIDGGRGRAALPGDPARRSTRPSSSTSELAGLASADAAGLAAGDRREAVRHRSGQRARAERASCTSTSTRSQVFRIDHYLGKETVQNLLVFRFAQRHVRAGLEPALHRSRADHCRRDGRRRAPRAATTKGAGALRDMVQNHLMQLLALVAMEPPIAFSAENVRDRKHRRAAARSSRWSRTARAATVTDVVRAPVCAPVGERRAGAGLPRASRTSSPAVDDRDLRRAAAAAR